MSARKDSAFDRAAKAKPARATTSSADLAGRQAPQRKYTLRLDASDADQLDELILRARKQAERRIDRNALIRTLLDMCASDDDLLNRVLERLQLSDHR